MDGEILNNRVSEDDSEAKQQEGGRSSEGEEQREEAYRQGTLSTRAEGLNHPRGVGMDCAAAEPKGNSKPEGGDK